MSVPPAILCLTVTRNQTSRRNGEPVRNDVNSGGLNRLVADGTLGGAMGLEHWNQRLATHFAALRDTRKTLGVESPVFALEHGLQPGEVQALSAAIRAHIQADPPSRTHSLAWIVYAAEVGYRYAGDEFWQTFEAETPGWTERGSRDWVRDAFVSFARRFAGATPSGAWATQFSIICWPITHAILPRDLQQQLARILYELRHSFSGELFDEPQRLGDFIAARSWNTSARFQHLVQEPAFVGQIAAALLLQGRDGFKTLLDPLTLKRIGDDVDRERRGREWLRGARRAAEERAKVRGLAVGRPSPTTIERREEARAEVERLGIEPRIVLRPVDGSRWEVSLEIPDLSHLLLRFPQVRTALTESRCSVAGAVGRPLARGRLLNGPQRVPLGRWPRSEDVLLKFERTDPQLDYLMRAECMLRPGTSWLFRVASDGLAYESRGMRVRANSKYLVLSTNPFARSSLTREAALTCQGVHALHVDIPPAVTPEWEQVLRDLHLAQAKAIEVWPVGLAAVAWDGEGRGEWLASETPTLAIRSDHAVDELTIAMGDDALSLPLKGTPPGEPIFVELPPLAVGLHKVTVAARTRNGAESKVLGDLDVVMRVREARSWSPGVTSYGPLAVDLEPAAPSLEQLWEGNAAVAVRGPAGRQVRCRVQMFTRAESSPLFERQLPVMTLPISKEDWSRQFEDRIKGVKDAQNAYDEAQSCEVEFSADELGGFTLRCEREFRPLRWSLRRGADEFIARLRDDTGTGVPALERYSFERPTVGEKLSPATELKAPRAGGLYVATLGDFRAAIVVPPIVKDLSDLRCAPQVVASDKKTSSIMQFLSLARLWGEARLSGDLIAGARQRLVTRELSARIAALLGGDDWSRVEAEFARGEVGLRDLRRAVPPRIGANPLISLDQIFPQEDLGRLSGASLHERGAAFVAFATRLQASVAPHNNRRIIQPSGSGLPALRRTQSTTWLAEFALRTASAPGTIGAWAQEHAEEGIQKLRETPALARAARFLVLAVDQHRKHAAAGESYAGWGWST